MMENGDKGNRKVVKYGIKWDARKKSRACTERGTRPCEEFGGNGALQGRGLHPGERCLLDPPDADAHEVHHDPFRLEE